MKHNQYDAIIAGSGLGGLTAAATLARAGLKVRVLEQHSLPGGYASTFSRGRFEFEVALHAMSGYGSADNRGPIFHILDNLGIASRVDFVELKDVFRSITPDLDFVMPVGDAAAIDALCTQFPREHVGITSVMKQLMEIGSAIEHMRSLGPPGSSAGIIAKYPSVGLAAGIPLGRILNTQIKDYKARLAIAQLWGYFGRPPSDLSLLMFAAGMYNYVHYTPVVPRLKSQVLSDTFVEVIRASGGEVTLSCPVTRILCGDGRVKGIETAHGEQFEAPIVVSNICAMTTLTRLIAPEHVPASLTDRLGRIPPSVSTFNVYLGLNCPSAAVGITNHEVFLNRDFDLESHYLAGASVSEGTSISITAYDVLNPDACPAGTGLVTLTLLVEGAPWEKLPPHEYQVAKSRIARALIRDVNARFPGFADHIETMSIATPLTNARYTGNTRGAVYGFAMTPGQSPAFRMDPRGHLKGLWYASAWTRPGGGFQATINAGHFAADAILRELPASVSSRVKIGTNPYARVNVTRATLPARLTSLGQIFKNGKLIKLAVMENKKSAVMSRPVLTNPEETFRAVDRIHAPRIPAKVLKVIRESHDTVTLRLAADGGSFPPFEPGQYFTLSPDTEGSRVSRPYSVSSSATDSEFIDFTVKRKPDGFISGFLVDTAREGDAITLGGPWGNFRYLPQIDQPGLLAIAAGSGVTPFISMIKTFMHGPHPDRMTLIFGSRTENDILFRSTLDDAEKACGWLRVIHVLSQPHSSGWRNTGRISPALLDAYMTAEALVTTTCLICGPRDLFTTMSAALLQRGVPRLQIRTESFGPDVPASAKGNGPGDSKTVSISVCEGTSTAAARTTETLLGALERAGHGPPSKCRSNVCNSCRMELVEGQVIDAATSRIIEGPAHIRTCMCFPVTDIRLR